jgi:hypothetical protein
MRETTHKIMQLEYTPQFTYVCAAQIPPAAPIPQEQLVCLDAFYFCLSAPEVHKTIKQQLVTARYYMITIPKTNHRFLTHSPI